MAPTFINIDNLLGSSMKNRVALLGVELEGGWKLHPKGIDRIEPDASVFKDPKTKQHNYPPGTNYAGEVPIGPFQPVSIETKLKKYYPDFIDQTCGMHVHMSFESANHYSLLMEPEYQETILEYLTRWAVKEGFPKKHHIFDRLSGSNIFCQKAYWPDEQYAWLKKDYDKVRRGHRYTVVNYSGRHKTIEIRVLPMMDTVEQAVRAVRFIVDITNACLVKLGKRTQTIKETINMSAEASCEEHFEEVVPLTLGERKNLTF